MNKDVFKRTFNVFNRYLHKALNPFLVGIFKVLFRWGSVKLQPSQIKYDKYIDHHKFLPTFLQYCQYKSRNSYNHVIFLLPYNFHITIYITTAKQTYIVFLWFSLKCSTKDAVNCFFRKAPSTQASIPIRKLQIFFDQVC